MKGSREGFEKKSLSRSDDGGSNKDSRPRALIAGFKEVIDIDDSSGSGRKQSTCNVKSKVICIDDSSSESSAKAKEKPYKTRAQTPLEPEKQMKPRKRGKHKKAGAPSEKKKRKKTFESC